MVIFSIAMWLFTRGYPHVSLMYPGISWLSWSHKQVSLKNSSILNQLPTCGSLPTAALTCEWWHSEVTRLRGWLKPMDWFKGKITGKPHISWENQWFPVDFPLNQSIDESQFERAASLRSPRALAGSLNVEIVVKQMENANRLYQLPSGELLHFAMERSTMLLMGKSTISTGPFSSSPTVSHYQRVTPKCSQLRFASSVHITHFHMHWLHWFWLHQIETVASAFRHTFCKCGGTTLPLAPAAYTSYTLYHCNHVQLVRTQIDTAPSLRRF